MTPALFVRVGEALYGPAWHHEMGRILNVSVRNIRRWASGDYTIPDGIIGELANVCERHGAELNEMAHMLRAKARAAERAAASSRLLEE